MDKNDSLLVNRFHDLAYRADVMGSVTFSNFLNLNEISVLSEEKNRLEASYELFGGFSNAERQIACFQSDAFSLYGDQEITYPIYCMKISFANKKLS